jgi:hypothetical protein
MSTILIIILVVIFIFYLFNNDRKDVKINVLQRGGLRRIYPNFVQYINQAHDQSLSFFNFDTTPLELAKDDGEYLHYKFPKNHGGTNYGYYYIGIHHTFGTIAECFSINKHGRKIEGFMRELHNGRSAQPIDRSIDDYRSIFSGLIYQMENLPNFEEKFYFNNF